MSQCSSGTGVSTEYACMEKKKMCKSMKCLHVDTCSSTGNIPAIVPCCIDVIYACQAQLLHCKILEKKELHPMEDIIDLLE